MISATLHTLLFKKKKNGLLRFSLKRWVFRLQQNMGKKSVV